MTQLKPALLPCPFCGGTNGDVVEASTFRWRAWHCECGITGPEARIQTAGEGTHEEWEAVARQEAIEAWNTRAALRGEPVADRERVLLGLLEMLRQHPDFDAGGPFADAIDEALRGETPQLLIAAAHLRQGLKPPAPQPSPAEAVRKGLRLSLDTLKNVTAARLLLGELIALPDAELLKRASL